MSERTRRFLYWAPRVLGIVFAAFISLFAMDVFGEGRSFWETVLALLIHMVPTYLVIIALVLAWRWEWIGAALFLGLAVFYVLMTWGRFHWGAAAGISGPLALLGGLFLIGWIRRKEIRAPKEAV
jgi:hypothetical protein